MSSFTLISGGGGVATSSAAPTLAAVLHDEAAGVVRDALTANGIYRRQWEEKWMAQGVRYTDSLLINCIFWLDYN